jgi:hypothetical protein
MFHAPKSLAADGNPDADGLIAMRAALRDFKVSMRPPVEHPRRAEMLDMLADARARIDRINQPNS